MRFKFLFIFFLTYSLAGTHTLKASTNDDDRWEVAVQMGFTLTSINTCYNHSYSPLLVTNDYPDFAATASQELNIQGSNGVPIFLTVNRRISSSIGLQLLAGMQKVTFGGANTSFYAQARWRMTVPPDYEWKEFTREVNLKLPDTEGFLHQYTLALNIFKRFFVGSQFSLDLSAGISLLVLNGEISTLEYVQFATTHFIMVYFPYDLKFSIDEKKLAFNVGGTLNVPLGNHLFLCFSCRYLMSPGLSAALQLKEVLNWDPGDISQEREQEIMAVMNPSPIELNPSILTVLAGIKVIF